MVFSASSCARVCLRSTAASRTSCLAFFSLTRICAHSVEHVLCVIDLLTNRPRQTLHLPCLTLIDAVARTVARKGLVRRIGVRFNGCSFWGGNQTRSNDSARAAARYQRGRRLTATRGASHG